MTTQPDAGRALYGAYRLARLDRDGFSFFATSIEAFWHSFRAALIVAPLFLLLLGARLYGGQVHVPLGQYLAIEYSAYALSWLVFPVVMEALSRTMGCRDKYVPFIIAYNWAMVPQYVVFISIITLGLVGIIPLEVSETLSLLVLIWAFIYTGFIVKTALDVSVITAVGIVFLDFLLGLTLDLAITS